MDTNLEHNMLKTSLQSTVVQRLQHLGVGRVVVGGGGGVGGGGEGGGRSTSSYYHSKPCLLTAGSHGPV